MRQLFITLIIGIAFVQWGSQNPIHYELEIPDKEAEFGIEDRNGRLEYERLLIKSPVTGTIPVNIRKKELAFAQELDLQNRGSRTQALDISSIGPDNVGGRTRAVALDVRDENTILAGGVSGGIWKSTNGGVTWTRKSDPENRNSVTCIVQDTRPGREDTWYHGTGELFANSASQSSAAFRGNGIYKSTDNGESWNVIPSTVDSEPSMFNSQFQYIWNIALNDDNLVEDEVLVAAFGGILRSVDGGDSWVAEIGPELFNLPSEMNLNDVQASFFTDIEKAGDGIFFATLSTFSAPDGDSPDAGMYVTEDRETWYNISPFTPESRYRRVVMSDVPTIPGQCYFLVDTGPPFLMRYNLTGFNAGGPTGGWAFLEGNVPNFGGQLGDFDAQGSFNMTINIHPDDSDIVFIGGTNLYRSRSGFLSNSTTDWIGGYDPEGGAGEYNNHHPDQHDIVFFPSNPNKIISANDGGLMVTDDVYNDSVTWTSLNNGFLTTQFFTIALAKEANDNYILGGMQDNGTDLSSGTKEWVSILGGDGGYAAATPGKEFWYSSFQRGQTFKLVLDADFDLRSFTRVDPEPFVDSENSQFLFINPFIVDPMNPNRIFMAGGNFLYVNHNIAQIPAGANVGTITGWHKVNHERVDFGVISCMDISLGGSTLYFGTTNGLLYKMDDADQIVSNEAIVITPANFPEDAYLSSISVNPENDDHLVVTFSSYEVQSIFESINGGNTFTDVSGNLEQFPDGSGNGPSVRWNEIIPTNNGLVYVVGTSTGLYSTEMTNGQATTWVKESPGLIGSAVIPMLDYRASDGRLAVATHGNGVFATNIDDFKPIEIERSGDDFTINSAFPNPFNTSTQIEYSIPDDGVVRINLYTRKGELVRTLLWGHQFAGENSVTWNGKNGSGTDVGNGIYLYRIEYNGSIKGGKLLVRK